MRLMDEHSCRIEQIRDTAVADSDQRNFSMLPQGTQEDQGITTGLQNCLKLTWFPRRMKKFSGYLILYANSKQMVSISKRRNKS